MRKRCYSMFEGALEIIERFLLEKIRQPKDTEEAIEAGLWSGNYHSFHSFAPPLSVLEVFRILLTNGQMGVR